MNLSEALEILGIKDVAAVDEAVNYWALFYHPDNYTSAEQSKASHFLRIVHKAAQTAKRLGKTPEDCQVAEIRICDSPYCREGRLILANEKHKIYGQKCYHLECAHWETSELKVGFDNVQSIFQSQSRSSSTFQAPEG